VNYCKFVRLLIKRDLPTCIIRVLINMYTGHLIRISWAGVMFDYFNALNGVKQGGVTYIKTAIMRISFKNLTVYECC